MANKNIVLRHKSDCNAYCTEKIQLKIFKTKKQAMHISAPPLFLLNVFVKD